MSLLHIYNKCYRVPTKVLKGLISVFLFMRQIKRCYFHEILARGIIQVLF